MATTGFLEKPLHDYERILITAEGVAGSLGFLLNAGVLLILLRLKDRNALLTMTLSLSISDMLTGLFHMFVPMYPELNFQDYGTYTVLNRARIENLAVLDSDLFNTPTGNGSWSLKGEVRGTGQDADFVFGDVFDSSKSRSFYDTYDFLNTSADMENFMNDMFQQKLKHFSKELGEDQQTGINKTAMEKLIHKLSQYEIAIVIVNYLNIIPYMSCILNMIGLSLCLLIIVTKPLNHRTILTKFRVQIYICITWTLAIIISIASCIYVLLMNRDYVGISVLSHSLMAATTITNLIIFLSLVTIYCIILFTINCRRAVPLSSHKRRRSIKSVAAALTIVGSYFICYQPIIWSYVLEDMIKRNADIKIWIRILPLLATFNTIIDALVYAFRLETVSETGFLCLSCILNIFKRKQSNVKGRRIELSNEQKQELELQERCTNVANWHINHDNKI